MANSTIPRQAMCANTPGTAIEGDLRKVVRRESIVPLSRRTTPALAEASPAPEGLLTKLHGLFLILVLPFAVLWIPIVSAQDVGNLTALDCVLFLLWVTTIVQLGIKSRYSTRATRAIRIAVYAFAPAGFGVLGALLFDLQSPLTSDRKSTRLN